MEAINPQQLAECMIGQLHKLLIIDSRSFLEYNDGHVIQSINIGCSKLIKRRLISNKVTIHELIKGTMEDALESDKIIVYDQGTLDTESLSQDNFMCVVLNKLVHGFKDVFFLKGEYMSFCYQQTHHIQTAVMYISILLYAPAIMFTVFFKIIQKLLLYSN